MKIDHPCGETERGLALATGARQGWAAVCEEYQLPSPFEGDSASAAAFVQTNQKNLQRRIFDFEPKTVERLGLVNARLTRSGSPPIQLRKTTEEIEAIANNRSLSGKEKKRQIDAVRKRLGLRKGEMRALFTQRLKRIYAGQSRDLSTYRNHLVTPLKEEIAQAEKIYGKASPQAALARQRLRGIEERLAPYEDRLRSVRSLYQGLYPSFWSRVGSFFKGVFKNVVRSLTRWFPPLVLQAVPGLGTALTALFPPLGKAIEIGRKIYQAGISLFKTVRTTYGELKRGFEES